MGGRSVEVQSTQAWYKPAEVFPGSSVPCGSYWGSLSVSFLICKMRNNQTVSTSAVKKQSANAGDVGLIPGLGRSPGGGNTNPLKYSCLGNPWKEEPSGLQPMRSQSVGHDWVSEHAHALTSETFCVFFPGVSLFAFLSMFSPLSSRLDYIWSIMLNTHQLSSLGWLVIILRDMPLVQ